MEIIVAKKAGFCFGVQRAVDIAFEVADRSSMPAVTLGPIIHNPQVIERLRAKGISAVELIPREKSTIIIRTHGIDWKLHEEISRSGHSIIDATCPFVKKAQQYAKLLAEEGYQVLILGDANHPEVKGILSYAGESAFVVSESADLPPLASRVGIVVQTTQSQDALRGLIGRVLERTKELKVYNTICNSTALRLKETEAIAKRADLIFVVGGKNSANTSQLAKLAASLGVRTFHIETAAEIQEEWLSGAAIVGITAGASTPEWLIGEVKQRLEAIGGKPAYDCGEERTRKPV